MANWLIKRLKSNKSTTDWRVEMTDVLKETKINLYQADQRGEKAAFALSYLKESIKNQKIKEKELDKIDQSFLVEFTGLTVGESQQLLKKITSGTSSTDPLIFEAVFLGVETFEKYLRTGDKKVLQEQGKALQDLLNCESNDPEYPVS